jgi:hypothetical protein
MKQDAERHRKQTNFGKSFKEDERALGEAQEE